MQGDDRSRVQVQELDLQKINEALRKLSDQIARIEGRSGFVNLRDSVKVKSDRQTLFDFDSPESGSASIVSYGTENATIAFAKGSRKDDDGDWIATDTVSTIWALDRAGNGTLYTDTGLTVGQAFTPTVSFVLGTGGSVTPHVLDSSSHTISGKTAGHVLQATSATAFAFAALTGLNVTNTPAGNIAATTAQAAINELDTEKVAKAGDTMTGALVIPDLGDTTPSIYFTGDTNTGIAYESADQWAMLANGAAQLRIGNGFCTTIGTHYFANSSDNFLASSGIQVKNATTWQPTIALYNTNADTSAAQMFLVKHSASMANGDYLGLIGFEGYDSASNNTRYADILVQVDDITNGSEDATIYFRTSVAGTHSSRMSIADKVVITTNLEVQGTTYFDDTSFYALVNAGDCLISFDSTDYISFARSSNTYNFVVGGTLPFAIWTDTIQTTSATTANPNFIISNTNNDTTDARIVFKKIPATASSIADNDALGLILWQAYDDAGNTDNYGYMRMNALDVSSTTEDGELSTYITGAGATNREMAIHDDLVWVDGTMSALTVTDRTDYPKDKIEAYDAVKSMEGKDGKLDHDKLHSSLKSIATKPRPKRQIEGPDGTLVNDPSDPDNFDLGRNLSMTVSALAEVVKDLITRIDALEKKP